MCVCWLLSPYIIERSRLLDAQGSSVFSPEHLCLGTSRAEQLRASVLPLLQSFCHRAAWQGTPLLAEAIRGAPADKACKLIGEMFAATQVSLMVRVFIHDLLSGVHQVLLHEVNLQSCVSHRLLTCLDLQRLWSLPSYELRLAVLSFSPVQALALASDSTLGAAAQSTHLLIRLRALAIVCAVADGAIHQVQSSSTRRFTAGKQWRCLLTASAKAPLRKTRLQAVSCRTFAVSLKAACASCSGGCRRRVALPGCRAGCASSLACWHGT